MIDLFNRKKVKELEARIAALESNESFTPYQISQLSKALTDSNYLLLVTSENHLFDTSIIIPPDKKGLAIIGDRNIINGCVMRFAKYKISIEE